MNDRLDIVEVLLLTDYDLACRTYVGISLPTAMNPPFSVASPFLPTSHV